MSVNKIQDGEIMEFINSGSAIASGDIVVVGERIGVAVVDIAATTGKGSVDVSGVFELPKTTSQSWAQGDKLFYASGTGKLTTVATGNTPAGYAFEDAGSSATVGNCKLDAKPKQVALQADTVAADLTAMKADFNALLAKLKAAGVMANS